MGTDKVGTVLFFVGMGRDSWIWAFGWGKRLFLMISMGLDYLRNPGPPLPGSCLWSGNGVLKFALCIYVYS
jgi:hypothetical protein